MNKNNDLLDEMMGAEGDDVPGGRMEIDGIGAGEASVIALEQRAAELARTEGRDEVSEGDRSRARHELNGPVRSPAAPEVADAEVDALVSWDEPIEASGRRAERQPEVDEATIAEQLVEEGVEEADHQQRVSAVNEQDRESGGD